MSRALELAGPCSGQLGAGTHRVMKSKVAVTRALCRSITQYPLQSQRAVDKGCRQKLHTLTVLVKRVSEE
jgi:hypothetical protein